LELRATARPSRYRIVAFTRSRRPGKRNWVRWLTVISGAIGCALTPLNLARLHDRSQVTCYWLQFALSIPVVIILVLPSATGWYTRNPKASAPG